MADPVDQSPRLPSRVLIIRGIQAFVLFSALGLAVAFLWKDAVHIDPSRLRWNWVAALIPLVGLDYLLGGFRYRIFFDGRILPRVSLAACMRANWANIFMGAATPFQTGGGPAQLYMLWRAGAKISDGILVSLVTFAATLAFFVAAAAASLWLLPGGLLGAETQPYLNAGFATVGGMAGGILFLLLFPRVGHVLLRLLVRVIPGRSPRALAWRERFHARAAGGIDNIHRALGMILRTKGWSLGVVVGLTFALFFNKYVMGYAIARALDQPVPFGTFLSLQIIQLFLIYFAPTPGASGVAELSSVWLMASVMEESVLIVYSLLWRFATTVLGAIIGGGVLLAELRSADRTGGDGGG